MGSVFSCSRRHVCLPSERNLDVAETLVRHDRATSRIDVQILTPAGEAIKLSDILEDISGKTNIRDVKHSLSAAISCSMYSISLACGVDKLSNSSLLSHLGYQGNIRTPRPKRRQQLRCVELRLSAGDSVARPALKGNQIFI